MARTRVRWGRVGGLLAAAGVALTVAASSAQAGGADTHPQRHVVQAPARVRHVMVRPGDTLWAIASRVAGPGADPRPVVDAIARANHLGATLAVGARLVVPR
jgi:nucleoid-associated protein YgaU